MYSDENKFSITMFVYARKSAPVFNTPKFPYLFQSGDLYDASGHMRILEFIAFIGEKFQLIGEIEDICMVTVPSYPSRAPLYVDKRSISTEYIPKERVDTTREKIVEKLFKFPKLPYLLGGNLSAPLVEWKQWHPTYAKEPYLRALAALSGLDCSGLLYNVMSATVPRNTIELAKFCTTVTNLEPLDLLLKPGHVLIYLGRDHLIESREKDGVTRSYYSRRKKEFSQAGYKAMRLPQYL